MNKEIIKLTEDLGNVYTEISKKKLEITGIKLLLGGKLIRELLQLRFI